MGVTRSLLNLACVVAKVDTQASYAMARGDDRVSSQRPWRPEVNPVLQPT